MYALAELQSCFEVGSLVRNRLWGWKRTLSSVNSFPGFNFATSMHVSSSFWRMHMKQGLQVGKKRLYPCHVFELNMFDYELKLCRCRIQVHCKWMTNPGRPATDLKERFWPIHV